MSDTRAAPPDLLTVVRELARLLVQRDEINAQITNLEAQVQQIEASQKQPAQVKHIPRPSGFQRPTWEILDLFKKGERLHSWEVIERSAAKYGDRYSPSAVRSSLYRLAGGELLIYDGSTYHLPREKKV